MISEVPRTGAPLPLNETVRTVHVEQGKTLLLVGPCSFELLDGQASILGAPLGLSSRIIVTRGKQTPIEVLSTASFRIRLGQAGQVETVEGSTIPLSWHEAASALAQLDGGTAVVVGGPDTGKTTLCTFLANYLVREDKPVAVVDADIGQTDLGPPTTMAAGDVMRCIENLSRIVPSERFFVGFTSPGRVKSKVIHGVKKLVGCHARPGRLVIVNTDGWVTGSEAAAYKVQMLDELQPDITLGIGGGNDISTTLQAGNRTTLLVGSPDIIRERTRVDRRELRSLGYRRYLAGSSVKVFRLGDVRLQDTLSSEALELRLLSRSRIENLTSAIVGFLDEEDFLSEIGVLQDIVPSTMTVKILCRRAVAPKKIEVGDVKLSKDGCELGYVRESRNRL